MAAEQTTNSYSFSPLSELPQEILVEILSFLELKDLVKIRKSNHFFKEISYDDAIIGQVVKNSIVNNSVNSEDLSKNVKKSIIIESLKILNPYLIPGRFVIPYIDALIGYNNPEQSNKQKVQDLNWCSRLIHRMSHVIDNDTFRINRIRMLLSKDTDILTLASITKKDLAKLPPHLKRLILICAVITTGVYGSIKLKDISLLVLMRLDQFYRINNKSTYSSLLNDLKNLAEPTFMHKAAKSLTNPVFSLSLTIGLAILLDKQMFFSIGSTIAISGFGLYATDIYLDASRRKVDTIESGIAKDLLYNRSSYDEPIDETFSPDDETLGYSM